MYSFNRWKAKKLIPDYVYHVRWEQIEMEFLLNDLRFAMRTLRKSWGFSLIVVFTLAVGIGASTSIFSVAHAVLLRPLPYFQPDRLVMIWPNGDDPSARIPVSPPIFAEWRERQSVFEDIAAYEDSASSHRPRFFLSGGSVPERIWGARISANLLQLLGVNPVIGRTFSANEEQIGSDQVVILSDSLWRRRFGADPKLLGKIIRLNDKPYTVVGVMPPDFKLSYPRATDAWTPLSIGPKERADRYWVDWKVIGRLKRGVTLGQAQASMNIVAQEIMRENPADWCCHSEIVAPLHEEIFGPTRTPFLILMCAVGFVLLIACVNVINLLLARGTNRTREMAVRAALGASRWRLVRQQLCESALLSFVGGVLGLLLAFWTRSLLVRLLPATLPRADEVRIDGWVLGFTVLLSIGTGLFFGIAPALRASWSDFNKLIVSGTGNTTSSSHARRWGGFLAAAEVGLALVLLTSAGLMLRSFWQMKHLELGFEPSNIVTMQFTIPIYRHLTEPQEAAFIERVVQRVQAIPGVVAAASTTSVPLRGVDYLGRFRMPEYGWQSSGDRVARNRTITPDYFRVMGIPLLEGRFLTDHDDRSSPPVFIVSAQLARQFYPGQDPIGRLIGMGDMKGEIVGVVGDVRHDGIIKPVEPAMYESLDQAPSDPACLVVRTIGEPGRFAAQIQQAVWAEDKDLPVENPSTMQEITDAATADTRFYSVVLTIFALVALGLGALGIYGVISYAVAQRTREIGIRMALGAERGAVLRMVLRQGLTVALAGVIFGAAGAFGLTRVMGGLLYGVKPADPIIFAGVAFLLINVALLASYIPARRAMRVDPMVALRYE
jgi:putative ABC transport system permease protein